MRKLIACLLFVTASAVPLSAQNLPLEVYLSADGRMLFTGGKPSSGIYDSAQIRDLKLTFPQANYWTLLTNNYQSQTEIPASLEVDGLTYDSVGVRFRGNTSYTQLGNSQKKSFKISLDFIHPDQHIMGYKSLKLNNQFGDQSFLREVFYLHQIRKHIPAAKANFVHLYLNDADWGIYPNVQLLNKDFLEEWFLSNDGVNWRADAPGGSGPGGPGGPGAQWGDGTAALNYLGADTSLYQDYYTLKSTDIDDPWQKLIAGCNALNNTTAANLPTVLPQYLDVDRVLWFLASEVAFSDDDSYIMKGKMDYYVYYEKETGRLTPIEYDGNSVLSSNNINWGPFYNANKVNYPLLNKMLAVPAWRQRYLAHLRTIISESLDASAAQQVIDNYKTQIDALYQSDPKKLYTYAQFISGVSTLKTFVNTRRTNLLGNAEVAQLAPQISQVSYFNSSMDEWTAPGSTEGTFVKATVASTNGISVVNLYYAEGQVGNFTSTPMFDDGAHQDGASGDGVYGAAIPAFPAGSWVRFYVEALANNAAKSASYMPAGAEHNVYVYKVVQKTSPLTGIVINEFMASNSSSVMDEAGEYDDWVELYNNTSNAVDISGFHLSDNFANPGKWEIPSGTIIQPDGYVIIWADENGSQGTNHCNFKLSASGGERLMLSDTNRDVVDSLSFGIQSENLSYSRIPNGVGAFIIKAHTFNGNNEGFFSVNESATELYGFRYYPNPASTWVQIFIDNPNLNGKLLIFNSVGQTIYESAASPNLSITVEDWSPGVYLMRYGTQTERLIIVR